MRNKPQVSIYLDPEMIQKIDSVRKNIGRSTWIERQLIDVLDEK